MSSRAAVPWPAIVWVIVGRNQGQTALAREALSDRLAILAAVAIVENDFSTIAFCRDALHRRRIRRHDDDAGNVEDLAGEGDRLRVVPGREGDDAAAPFVGGEARKRVVGAAELEGAGALEVLALEEQAGAGPRIHRARRGGRSLVSGAGDLFRGALDVIERWECHGYVARRL